MADFTWAEATLVFQVIPWSGFPVIFKGAQLSSFMLTMSAPICCKGSMTRFMGRRFTDSSPVM